MSLKWMRLFTCGWSMIVERDLKLFTNTYRHIRTFLGTKPRDDIRKTGKGGDEERLASLWASSSLECFALTAFGFCKAKIRLGTPLGTSWEQRHPWKCKGKPDVKPDSNNCTSEWLYPKRKGSIRLMFTGVGNCWAGLLFQKRQDKQQVKVSLERKQAVDEIFVNASCLSKFH